MKEKVGMNLVRVLLVFCALMMFGGVAFGHAASNVQIRYLQDEGILEVVATHEIRSDRQETPYEHYIKEYVVTVDGKEVKRVKQNSQFDSVRSIARIELPNVQKGSTIHVEAICNRTGVNGETITVQ